jgi:hypothetical protein
MMVILPRILVISITDAEIMHFNMAESLVMISACADLQAC